MPVLRLQKILSLSGIASRRKAEELISTGKVLVNDKTAKLGSRADPETDTITVNGKPLKMVDDKIYLALNKPKGYVSSKSDPEGRKTIYELLPKTLQNKVWSIGRLDFQTEGLIILTNDGELTQKLSHPSFEHEKEYEVVVNKMPTDEQLTKLRKGVTIDGSKTFPAEVEIVRPHPSPSPKGRGKTDEPTVRLIIHEGRNRQIRKMVEAVGLKAKNLKRIRIGKLKLSEDLLSGQLVEINQVDILQGF